MRIPIRFYLLPGLDLEAGVCKARCLLDRLAIPGNRLLALRTQVPTTELKDNARTGVGCYVETGDICLDDVAWIEGDLPRCRLAPVSVEEATAAAFRLLQPNCISKLQRMDVFRPASRHRCQAMPVTFSEASASAEQEQERSTATLRVT